MERGKTEPEVVSATKQCPECLSSIPARAGRTVVQPQPDR